MARFEIGKEYAFVRVLFTAGAERWGNLFVPWEDKLHEIQVLKVKCIEHHKVPWDQDPEGKKECDGFLFVDETGQQWANQYPSACYGQLDNTNDGVIFPHPLTDQNAAEISEIDEGYFWGPRWTRASWFLNTIFRGERLESVTPEQKEQLKAYRLQVEEKVKEKTGHIAKIETLKGNRDDGSEWSFDRLVVGE